jgi:hypothetical protein
MRPDFSFLTTILLLCLTTSAFADAKLKVVRGKIAAIAGVELTIQSNPDKPDAPAPAPVTIKLTDKTAIRANGGKNPEMTATDLRVGQRVLVTLADDGTAATIMVIKYTPGAPG